MTEFEKAWGPTLKQAGDIKGIPTTVGLHLHMAKAHIVKGPVFLPQQRSNFGAWYQYILEVPAYVEGPGGSEQFTVTVELARDFFAGALSPQEYAQNWKPSEDYWDAAQKDLEQRHGTQHWGFRILKHPLPKWVGADSSARWNVVG